MDGQKRKTWIPAKNREDDRKRERRGIEKGIRRPCYTSSETGLTSVPIRSISMVTRSPFLRKTGGFRANPTPCGVPVKITVPGNNVVPSLKKLTRDGTSKIMSEVVESCMVSSLSVVLILRLLGSGISSVVTRQGPRGKTYQRIFPGTIVYLHPLFASAAHSRRWRTYTRTRSRELDAVQYSSRAFQ